jgi:hypothetical protein
MFFVRQQQPETFLNRSIPISSSIAHLNELCLLNNLQREYAYRQQKIEKRQIQKINQPQIEFTQDIDNYYIILDKKVTRNNYSFMNKFNGYTLKQVDNSLIVKSPRDNFYKNFTLPENIDLEADITYKLRNNGYSMLISIPKKNEKYQLTTTAFRVPDMFDNLRLLTNALNNRDCYAAVNEKNVNEKAVSEPKMINAAKKIKIPITHDDESEEINVLTKANPENGKEQDEVMDKSNIDNEDSYLQSLTNDTQKEDDEIMVGTNVDNEDSNLQSLVDDAQKEFIEPENAEKNIPNLLKNYNTIRRQTVFTPNTIMEDSKNGIEINDDSMEEDVDIPVKKNMSPTIEDLVDEEFL